MSNRAPVSAEDFLGGLRGRRVLVTAGAGGIGLCITDTLTALGARVVVCDVSDEALAAVRPRVVAAVRADVSADAEVDALFEETAAALGGLDALVNNAGIAGPTGGVDEIDPADWRRCLDVCLTGQFLCARRAVPMLKAAGGGAIVAMSSAAGRFGYAFRTPYAAAKWGVIGLTQSLAKELGPAGIRVNAVLPGISWRQHLRPVAGRGRQRRNALTCGTPSIPTHTHAKGSRAADGNHTQERRRHRKGQGDHHLRRDRGDPYPDHVPLPADHP